MTTETQTIEVLKKQIEVEKRTLDKLVKLEEDARETAVRLVFMDLRLDTWKHMKFLEGMIELLSTTPCDEWSAKVARYAGRVKLERELKSLIRDEENMVILLDEANMMVNDSVATLILQHMREEENSHRDDLDKLVTLIKQTPLQSKKGQKATDIVCDTD